MPSATPATPTAAPATVRPTIERDDDGLRVVSVVAAAGPQWRKT
jgi:hypothetical protein